jgi:hypothetical protein
MEQYQDDLLVSGLQLVLSAPLELLDIQYFVGPLQTALEIGLTQVGIASTAVDTLISILEQAQLQDDDRTRITYMQEIITIVPFLSNYLATDLQLHAEVEVPAETGLRQRAKKMKVKPEDKRHQISTGLLGVRAKLSKVNTRKSVLLTKLRSYLRSWRKTPNLQPTCKYELSDSSVASVVTTRASLTQKFTSKI